MENNNLCKIIKWPKKGIMGTKVTKMKQILKYGLNCIMNSLKTSSCIILDRLLQQNHTNEGRKDNRSVHLIKGVTCIYH